MNRFWQSFFGVGLVKSTEDFGVQGAKPSHPELLDWLAVDFIESGWDVKALCKQIVMSRTYRQSSRVTPELQERDPENRLLARASRHRLPSWMIRDQALFAAGLLTETQGGPPVRPYQPEASGRRPHLARSATSRIMAMPLPAQSLYLLAAHRRTYDVLRQCREADL